MRYLLISYVKTPSGKMDEMMTVTKNLKTNDLQTAGVILDFKNLKVVKANVNGVTAPKDWESLVSLYHQYYEATIERLFHENGWIVEKVKVDSETAGAVSEQESNQSE